MSPSRVAETLANGLAADPLFCDLLANLHLHLEHEVDLDRVVEIRRTSAAAVMSLADAIEQALPALGRSGALRRPSCRLLIGGSLVADRPPAAGADRRLRRGTGGSPDWKLEFASALTRLLTATCVGLTSESTERNHA